jgi:hypothetical protein
MDNVNALYNQLIELDLFTDKELELITNINGYSIDTLNDCLYSRFGYRSLSQMLGEDEQDDNK